MWTQSAMVANRAGVQNGLLMIEGGGWSFWTTPRLPAAISITLAASLRVDDTEMGQTPYIQAALISPSGVEVARAESLLTLDMTLPEGVAASVMVALPLNGVVTEVGEHAATLVTGGQEIARVPFHVLVAEPIIS